MAITVPVWVVQSVLAGRSPVTYHGFLEDLSAEAGMTLQEVSAEAYQAAPYGLILVATGGSEEMCRTLLDQGVDHPVYLLTYGDGNSLAASMEILAYLRQKGMTGEIIHGSLESVAKRVSAIVRVAAAKEALKGLRLGVVGKPSNWLIASTYDAAAVQKAIGAEIVEVPMDELQAEVQKNTYEPNVWTENLLSKGYDAKEMERALAVYGALKRIAQRYNLGGMTVRCFDLIGPFSTTGCLALAILNAEGIYAGCEGDVPALLSMAILGAVSGKPVFQCNPSRIEGDEIVFAHCTLPMNMPTDYSLMTHFESNLGVALRGTLPEEAVTLFKTSGDLRRYHAEASRIMQNLDECTLCRTQIRMKIADPSYFFTRAIQNHHLIAMGDHVDALNLFFASIGAQAV